MEQETQQVAMSFDKATIGKIVRGTLIAAGGAALTYGLQYLLTVDFGVYTPLVVMVLSSLINMTKEYIKGV